MELNEEEAEFVKYIMQNSDGSEVTVGDFVIRNNYGRNAYYMGTGGDVVIPSEITSDMRLDWNGVKNITSLTFPNAFKTLSDYEVGENNLPFKKNLRELILPEGLVAIVGTGCFRNCSSLETVYFPETLEYLGHNAFKNSPWFDATLELEDGCYYLGKFLYSSEKTITHAVVREGTVMIGEWAFKDCRMLEQVFIPDSVKTIGSQAFCGCVNLEEISGMLKVEEIGASAFTNCTKLKRFILKKSDVRVADNAFASPTRDDFHVPNEVYIPNVELKGLKPIQKLFFELCFLQGMENYSEEDTAYYIPFVKRSKEKLLGCIIEQNLISALKNIAPIAISSSNVESILELAQINGNLEMIALILDWKAHNVKTDILEKNLNRELSKNPNSASELKKIWGTKKLPDGSLAITSYKGKESIVDIPATIGKAKVTCIGRLSFSGMRHPVHHKTPEMIKVAQSLEKVVIPDGVTIIESSAFDCCKKLTEVVIPASVIFIDDLAFFGTDIKVLRVKKGSVAETFAIKNNIKIEYLSELN